MIKDSIIEYCAAIGKNPLLVQGAGGNVSWKENDVLWIKASGTWLAEAKEKDIFVPVDLIHLRNAIDKHDFSVKPKTCSEQSLRPSIETILHALMPHKVVVHLHAIEVLAHLVRDNCQIDLQRLLDNTFPWAIVDYYKPGVELAEVVHKALKEEPSAKIVFLKNHGVVVGGENVEEIQKIMTHLTEKLGAQHSNVMSPYAPIEDQEIQELARNPKLYEHLQSHWALYPDHVVFLGPRASTYPTWEILKTTDKLPELVFIENDGVYILPTFSAAKQLQLRCYYDIISRQPFDRSLKTLTKKQIAELLDWDAEKYRLTLEK